MIKMSYGCGIPKYLGTGTVHSWAQNKNRHKNRASLCSLRYAYSLSWLDGAINNTGCLQLQMKYKTLPLVHGDASPAAATGNFRRREASPLHFSGGSLRVVIIVLYVQYIQ